MSLGFSNISFPSEVTVDKLGDYYNAATHYNNAPTASLSISQSFATSLATGGGTATSALANNGNIAFCFEGTSTMTIVEGLGGTETQVSLPTGGDSWRGMVYDPQNDEFIVFADRVSLINATTFTTRQMGNLYPNGAQVWGGTLVDGKIYVGPYTTANTYIQSIDIESATVSQVGPSFTSTNQFMSSCITIDGTIVWGGENDDTIKEYNLITNTYSTLSNSIKYGGYQGWAPLSDGTLFNSGWNSSQYQIYTPASLNGGTSKIDKFTKNETNTGPWSNTFTGLDGRAYLVDSKGKNQLGGIYSDVYCYDPIEKNFFKTQFKFPAHSTGGDRQNQAVLVQEDGWVVSAGSRYDGEYHAVKMFEPTNDITRGSRTAGFSPNTAN